MLSGGAPFITFSAIGLCQIVQLFSLFNMNRHRNFDKFSQSFQISKFDLKFLDITDLQDSVGAETRRNLETNGYIDLSNVRLDTGSFVVNYMYWFCFVILLGCFHGFIIFLTMLDCVRKRERGDKLKKILKYIRKSFEYGVYFYILMATSIFIWLCVVNELAAFKFKTFLNIGSLFVSLIVLFFMFAVMLFPLLMLKLESRANKIGVDAQEEEKYEKEKTFIGKIWASYQFGVRKTTHARLFYTTLQFKYLLYSAIFVLIDRKLVQILSFILLTLTYCIYYCIVKPFKYPIQNTVIIINEFFILLLACLFCGFLSDSDPDDNLAIAIIVIFSFDIIGTYLIGFIFQVYLIKVRKDKERNTDSVPDSEIPRKEPDVLHSARRITEQQMKRQDRNQDSLAESRRGNPRDNMHYHVAKATMNQLDVESSSKDSDMEFHPDAKFLKNIENTVENSRVDDDRVNVLGGNL
jgi:hypothetical protein